MNPPLDLTTTLALAIGSLVFLIGFVIGLSSRSQQPDDDLWEILEDEQVDLDVFTGRNTDNVRWSCYHPHRYPEYKPKGFDTAREALQDYAEKNGLL